MNRVRFSSDHQGSVGLHHRQWNQTQQPSSNTVRLNTASKTEQGHSDNIEYKMKVIYSSSKLQSSKSRGKKKRQVGVRGGVGGGGQMLVQAEYFLT